MPENCSDKVMHVAPLLICVYSAIACHQTALTGPTWFRDTKPHSNRQKGWLINVRGILDLPHARTDESEGLESLALKLPA